MSGISIYEVYSKVSREVYRKVYREAYREVLCQVSRKVSRGRFSNLSKYFVCRNSRILFRDFYFLFFHTIFILEFENLGLYIFIEFICRIIHNNMWNCAYSIYYAN